MKSVSLFENIGHTRHLFGLFSVLKNGSSPASILFYFQSSKMGYPRHLFGLFSVLKNGLSTASFWLIFSLQKWAIPASFWFIFSPEKWAIPSISLVYFRLFKQTLQLLTRNQCEKCPSSIWYQESNPHPSEHGFSPKTPRPGLLLHQLQSRVANPWSSIDEGDEDVLNRPKW